MARATPTLKKKPKAASGGPSKAQRDWVDKLNGMGDGGGATGTSDDKSAPKDGAKLEGAGPEGALNIFGLPIDPTDLQIRATIRIENRTEQTLELVNGSDKLERDLSEFDTKPPIDITNVSLAIDARVSGTTTLTPRAAATPRFSGGTPWSLRVLSTNERISPETLIVVLDEVSFVSVAVSVNVMVSSVTSLIWKLPLFR